MNKTINRTLSVFLALALILTGYADAKASTPSNGQMPLASKIYYVSPAGNDVNSGTAAAPFKTLTKAVAALAAGDTLMVTGTFNQPLIVSKSGTASAPINIIGSAAFLNMNGTQSNGMKISGSHINISGFDVKGTQSHGVLISGKYVRFENSSVHHSILENGSGTCTGSGGWGSAVKVMVGGENVVIRGNSVYENCGEGIGVTRGVNVLVENNTVRDNYSVNIYLDNSPYTTAQNNTVTCTGIYLRDGRRPTGIAVAEEEYSGWGAQRHDNYVLNNHVSGCYDGITSWLPEVSGGKLINSVISGNTVVNGIRRSIAISSENQGVLISNNTVFTAITVTYPSGVTMVNNTIGNAIPATATQVSPPTATAIVPASPTATVVAPSSPIATNQPVGAETFYDDKNNSFVYSTGWADVAAKDAYNGSYKSNSQSNASVTLNFTGGSFSILYTDGPTYKQMSVYVDGALVQTIKRATADTKYQQRWDYPGVLTAGAHTLKLVFIYGNGTFDAVIVPASPTAPGIAPVSPTATAIIPATPTATVAAPSTPTAVVIAPASPTATVVAPSSPTAINQPVGAETFYDDKNNSFVYSAGWADVAAKDAYNGSYKSNSKYNASVTLNFTGGSFGILYTDGPTYRQMSVYVDGVLVQTIKRATADTRYQQRWDYPGVLTAGAHTLKLVFVNGNGTFDAVIVR